VTDIVSPNIGMAVVHLFCKVTPLADAEAITAAVQKAQAEGDQVVTVAILGHKADLAFMALGYDMWRIRRLQAALQNAGLDIVDSYVSLTELSEYAQGVPEPQRSARLTPELPPEDKPAWCFYPMSKQRGDVNNWFTLPYDDRKELMYEHGASGRKFAGRVIQVVTGSTGLDDYRVGRHVVRNCTGRSQRGCLHNAIRYRIRALCRIRSVLHGYGRTGHRSSFATRYRLSIR